MTYAAPLKVTLRLVVWDIDEDTGARSVLDIKEQDVYMGDMPLMTDNGTFVVNGTERVIVSQMHRSPGVFFDHDKGKTHSSGKYLFAARVIPYRGSWLDFEFDAKDLVFVRIDRRRKLPATTLLLALDGAETAVKRAELAAKGEVIDPTDAEGMSKEEVLAYFYDTVSYQEHKRGWKAPFDPEAYRGVTIERDMINAKTGRVVAEAGTKMTPAVSQAGEGGLTEIVVPAEELFGRYVACDLINEMTGEVLVEAGGELTEELFEALGEASISDIPTLRSTTITSARTSGTRWRPTRTKAAKTH